MSEFSIAVCVKPVPEGSPVIDPGTLVLDRSGGQAANEADLPAVETAIRLRDSGGGQVSIVSMGGGDALAWLRTPLAMGADRALVVSDKALTGSDLLATSRVLSALLARESPDLVLFGQQATDSNGAVLFAAVANRLRLPLASRVVAIEQGAGVLAVRRRTEVALERLELPTPCVVAVSSGIAEPRIPSFRQLKSAGGKRLDVVSLADLGLDGALAGMRGSGTVVRQLSAPPARRAAVRVVDSTDAAARILEFLVSREFA